MFTGKANNRNNKSTLKIALMLAAISVFVAPAMAAQDHDKIKFCKQLAEAYKPSADVNYKPGVDVHGKAVVPADINGAAPLDMSNIYPIRIPLKLDIIERYNLDVPDGIIGEAPIAEIVVHQDGQTTYNEQDISSDLRVYCLDEAAKPQHAPIPSPQKPVHPPVSYDGEGIEGEYHE